MKRLRPSPLLAAAILLSLLWVSPCRADSAGPSNSDLKVMADTVWVMIAAMLVFFMNLGFGCVESGFCRAKNCVNILSKNFIVFAMATIAFWVLGFGLMFGEGNRWVGEKGLLFVSNGADKEMLTKDVAANAFKALVKEKLGKDLSDEKIAKSEEALLKQIDEVADSVVKNVTKAEESYTATLTVGTTKLEKKFDGKEFYWDNYPSLNWTTVPLWAKFFFQLVFAGTCATIVSGAVAERIKYLSFILFSFLLIMLVYPVVGHWIWGGGLLAPGEGNLFGKDRGMFDFAGSTVVHSVGGWAALAGVIVLGARIGKYGPDGKVHAIPGHNMTAAFIGCLVLWFGWFGFNPGSTMAADIHGITRVAVTTNTAAAFATLTATITAWILLGKPDIGMTLNGCLAGLVAITAPCAFVSVGNSAIIGAIAGVLVVFAVLMFDRLRIDDPVGATSVHLVNGVFGSIAVGLFGEKEMIVNGAKVPTGLLNDGFFISGGMDQLIPQVVGVLVVAAYAFPVSLVLWVILRYTVGIRVTAAEEIEGLDLGEHGNESYHGFVMAAASTEIPSEGAEPRSALVPPNDVKRFKAVVEGISPTELATVWSDLCQPQTNGIAADFKTVYPYLTTFQGATFRFRGGDPEQIRTSLERLLKGRMPQQPVKVRVET